MHVFRGLPSPLQRIPSAVAIGNFDGVHTGHQALLAGLVEAARERGLVPSVLTFEPHPREFFPHLDPVPRISTLCDKVKRLLDCGIERIYMMPFNEHIAREGAEAFVTNVLVNGLDARWVTVGEDFRFGSGRAAGAHDLERLGKEHHFETWISPLLFHGTAKVSSTRLRAAPVGGRFLRSRNDARTPLHNVWTRHSWSGARPYAGLPHPEYRTDSAGKPCSSGARRSLCRQSSGLGRPTVRRRLFGTSS